LRYRAENRQAERQTDRQTQLQTLPRDYRRRGQLLQKILSCQLTERAPAHNRREKDNVLDITTTFSRKAAERLLMFSAGLDKSVTYFCGGIFKHGLIAVLIGLF